MADFQIKKTPKDYDVCIVGSGAGGGMAAYVLANAGIKVVLLEAGPLYDPAKNVTQLKWPWESPRRGASTFYRGFGDFDAAYGGWELEGEPYTHKDGTKFDWFRSRMLGGRTNHWGRISLRFGPNDFKHRSIDGLGDDWPIGYDDVAPYYDKVDKLIGVFGSKEGIHNEPDGIFLAPPKPRLHELFIKEAGTQLGIPVIPSRLSILTEKINDKRGKCFFCSQCNRGCTVHADFSSSSVLVNPALETGNVDVIPNAMAREVLTDANGKATGISFVNKDDMQEYTVNARVVILAASACESARLLLNSKSSRNPNGLANSSGVVGKYLHDSTGASMGGILPKLVGRKRYNEDGVGGMHVYTPWWLDNKKLDFPRGYHIEYGGGMGMPGYGFGFGIQNHNGKYPGRNGKQKSGGGYGASLKDDYRYFYGATFGMAGRGEAIAREDNYCEIDPTVVDKYGIPVLRFNYTWSDYEIKQAKHMKETFAEIIDKMGGVVTWGKSDAQSNYGLEAPGRIIHEVGTTRMGDDKKKSVLNKHNQAHDCANLFVVDGGAFVSQADKNPTWTILALSMRASEYIIDEMKKKNTEAPPTFSIDRYAAELERDKKLLSETFFDEHEMKTISVLVDIIIPKDDVSGSATDAKVPEFIEFIAKDMPKHQLPLRGGLKWLDLHCMRRFNNSFVTCTSQQQIEMIDDIAYPESVKPELQQGAAFFTLLRDLTATGFFTSKIGIADLGYAGNRPNNWDGVPQDVLDQYGVKYDERTLKESVKFDV